MAKQERKPRSPQGTRMYIVHDNEQPGGEPLALIEAPNVQRALSHMARKSFSVRYAEQADIIAAVKAGLAPEQISAAEIQEDNAE